MRRFDTPTAPPGWAGQGANLLRIVDPTGRAIAWLAPDFGAGCVGYAVRDEGVEQGGWRQVFRASSPRELRADPLAPGCAVLGPEPGGGGGAHLARWRFVERDPTATTCAVRCGDLRLELAARLEDAALHFDLCATNEGTEPLPIALGLRCRFGAGLRPMATTPPDTAMRLVGDTPTTGFTVAPKAGTVVRWDLTGEPGSVGAWEDAAPQVLLPLGAQRRFALIVAPD